MTTKLKKLAKEISEKNNLKYKCVIHMFSLIKFNVDNKTKIDREDLSKFSKKWGINLASSTMLLSECQLMLVK